MKKSIYSALSLILIFLAFTSCEKTTDDLMTADAKTGGLVNPTGIIPYKLGMTPSFDIVVDVPKGLGIQTIEVQKYYTRMSDTTESNIVSTTIDINSENATAELEKVMTHTWATLKEGLVLPTDPQIPASENDPNIANFIGDYWTFKYICTLSDGRIITNTNTTQVSIANFFAGSYDLLMKYFHPTAGGSYPDTPYGGDRKSKADLVPIGALDCSTYFGVWQDNHVFIHIAADYTVTLTFDRADAVQGDPNNPANVCSYDPETGVIKLYYYYPGSGGNRIFWSEYTPR